MTGEYEHTVEVYELRPDRWTEPFGVMLRRFSLLATDTKTALDLGVDAVKAKPPAEHYLVVVFQGGLDAMIARPAGWYGTWPLVQWEGIRDAQGGLARVQALIAEHCCAARRRAERSSHRPDLKAGLEARAKALVEELDALLARHGFELAHEDSQGAFILREVLDAAHAGTSGPYSLEDASGRQRGYL